MASKGILKTGEAYCLMCNESLEPGVSRCPSCDVEFEQDVRAFACPRCRTVMAFGTPQCPKCNMKFKVKVVSPMQSAEDDKLLVKLIEWGKPPAAPTEASETPPQGPSPEELEKLGKLRSSIEDLMANRTDMLKRMEKRLEDEKARLERISALEGRSTTVEQIEAEVMSLADEMADITMLQAHMDALSDEVSSIIESFNLSDAAKERGLAAKALRAKLDEKERELAEIKSKEEQLAGREEMVDRKIKAYASKKKQLDDQENDLKSRLEALENERLELEKIRLDAVSAKTQGERDAAKAEWDEEKRRLRHRLIELRSVFSPPTGQDAATEVEVEKAEADIEGTILELDRQVRELLVERSDLQKRMADAIVIDEDLKRLLRVLDQLLGQLPEDIISKFSSSEDFALYERILDRMKI